MRKFVKYLILSLFSCVLACVLAVASVVVWAVRNPQSAWTVAQDKLLPPDLIISWKTMGFRWEHISGWNYKLDWTIEGLKITKGTPQIQLPIDHIRLHASLFPKKHEHTLVLHHFIVHTNEPLIVSLPASQPSENEKNPFQYVQQILSWTQKIRTHTRWEIMSIQIPNLKVSSGSAPPMDLSATFQQNSIQDTPAIHYKIGFTRTNTMRLIAIGDLFPSSRTDSALELKSEIDFSGWGVQLKQKLHLSATTDQVNLTSQGPLEYSNRKLKFSGRPLLNLKMNSNSIDVKIQTAVNGIPSPYLKVPQVEAHISIPLEFNQAWSRQPSVFSANVPIQISISDSQLKASIAKSCECQPPERLPVRGQGKIWLHTMLNPETTSGKNLSLLEADIHLDEIVNKLLSLNLAGTIKIEKQNENYKFHPSLDTSAHVGSFRALGRLLDGLGIMIPSPLDILDGTVDIKMNGPLELVDTGYLFPLSATAKLNSTNQTVDLSAKAHVNLPADFKSVSINTQLSIHQLQLELPPLKPTKGNPRIVKDSRILTKPAVHKKLDTFKVDLSVSVMTVQPGAVRLLAEYFKPHIPISISLQSTDLTDNSGFIKLEPFDIIYLRREVHVAKMNVDLAKSDENGFYVDGRLRVKQSQYTVFIDILGPANRPNIIFSSTPDLPRSEIINVLLYDRTSDQMLSTDVETSGQVESAVADKAIGLFGIWAFASTPIRGFSYNPSTKVYTATVELADDVTASVGTKWESSTQVELRKRVSRRWILTAAWTPAEEGQGQTSKLVLQWERRF